MKTPITLEINENLSEWTERYYVRAPGCYRYFLMYGYVLLTATMKAIIINIVTFLN